MLIFGEAVLLSSIEYIVSHVLESKTLIYTWCDGDRSVLVTVTALQDEGTILQIFGYIVATFRASEPLGMLFCENKK